MARMKEYVIQLSPISWKRPGIHNKRFYDQQSHEKLAIGLYINQIHGNDPKFSKPLHLDITFHMPIPKTLSKRQTCLWHRTFPDIDNLAKMLLDSITDTGIVWQDDNQVSSMSAKKVYDSNPRTHLIIKELE